jgi:class 3 adenylate cyclase
LRIIAIPMALPLGFALNLLFVSAASFVKIPSRSNPLEPSFLLVYIGLGGLVMVAQSLFSFMGGGVWRSVLTSLLYTVGGFGAQWTVHAVGKQYKVAKVLQGLPEMNSANVIGGIILATLIGFFAGLGAFLNEVTMTERRRRLNDPEVLLTDLITTQRRLNPDATVKCVVVVDAAKSSQMKANSDALTAEWSFRAYQAFLQHVVHKHNGTIHSTAGDGAVAVFSDCISGFDAAREIQTLISDFNKNTNRLNDPFRLRVGLHCDTVSGDLGEVQFAAVIDIAAHTEAASQVGGIAVTEPVKNYLVKERFAELPEPIDGYKAYIALQPHTEVE